MSEVTLLIIMGVTAAMFAATAIYTVYQLRGDLKPCKLHMWEIDRYGKTRCTVCRRRADLV